MAKIKSTPSRLGEKTNRKRLAKVLSICFVFSMLMTFAASAFFSMMSQHSAVMLGDAVELIQLEEPVAGSPKAIVHTTLGDLTFCLYPEECPQAVESFISLAESGYYDNTYIFQVEPGVYFSAGAPNADGSLATGTESHAREHVPQELSAKLWPFRGALCAPASSVEGGFWKALTNKREYFNGSRFLVTNTIEMTDEIVEELTTGEEGPKLDLGKAFAERGGVPNYAQQMTVFGQLTDGFDVLDAITAVAVTTDQEQKRPAEDIQILSVEITKYA